MTITLQDFRTQIRDVARPNRFFVDLKGSFTSILGGVPPQFRFAAKQATIPKLDINGPSIKYRGTSIILRGDYKKDPLTIVFWNENTWNMREYFENWLKFIVDPTTDNVRKSTSEYRFGNSILVTQIGGRETDQLAKYEYFDVAPLDISEIALDQGQENTLEEFSVIFQYSRWERLESPGLTLRTPFPILPRGPI